MHFVNCERIPQQAKIRFVAESATLLFFFDLFCCFGFHGQIAKTLISSKSLQKEAIIIFVLNKLELSRNLQL